MALIGVESQLISGMDFGGAVTICKQSCGLLSGELILKRVASIALPVLGRSIPWQDFYRRGGLKAETLGGFPFKCISVRDPTWACLPKSM